MVMTCRCMSEEGVEDPMGESRHGYSATKMGMTWSAVTWRFFRPLVALDSNNCGHG